MPVFLFHQSLPHLLKPKERLGSERHHLRCINQAQHGYGMHESHGMAS